MREQLEQYIKSELKALKYKGDKIQLKNVYPSLLEDVMGKFIPYELNGYDCDYWTHTDKYEIFGCMRFGTVEITLKIGKDKPQEIIIENKETTLQKPSIKRINDVPSNVLSDLKTFYFTFGNGQINSDRYQPIMAKNSTIAHEKMIEIYGTKWSFMYDETSWNTVGTFYTNKNLETIVAQ